jgi:hypothetical protein
MIDLIRFKFVLKLLSKKFVNIAPSPQQYADVSDVLSELNETLL